jgi:hypothetical protein
MPIVSCRHFRRAPAARTILIGTDYEEDVMPVLKNGDDRFERGGWESFKRKLIADTELTIEEAKRHKAIAEMLLAEFAVDRQIDQRAPRQRGIISSAGCILQRIPNPLLTKIRYRPELGRLCLRGSIQRIGDLMVVI